jgi:hypothetical protein
VIHDTNDARVDRRFVWKERKRRLPAADEEYVLAHAGTRGINGHERAANRRTIGGDGLEQQQFVARECRVFDGGNDVTDDAGELHLTFYV